MITLYGLSPMFFFPFSLPGTPCSSNKKAFNGFQLLQAQRGRYKSGGSAGFCTSKNLDELPCTMMQWYRSRAVRVLFVISLSQSSNIHACHRIMNLWRERSKNSEKQKAGKWKYLFRCVKTMILGHRIAI